MLRKSAIVVLIGGLLAVGGDQLLVYPVQHEGLEESPNIVYTGAAPNQAIVAAVKWSFDHLGRRVVLVGSDYVVPRTANAIIRDHLTAMRGAIVGEALPRAGRSRASWGAARR